MTHALHGSINAVDKHVILGLLFLKYISDAFDGQHTRLEAERAQGADPEDPDECRSQSIFWIPPEGRWTHLKTQAKHPTSGKLVEVAIAYIERDNPGLEGTLPRDYSEVRR
jgi:type I restriction enzyme M protein